MEQRMAFVLIGKSPLLTHNPKSMQAPKGGKGKTLIPSSEEEAKAGLYVDEEGRFCLPGISIRNSFIKAAGAWRGAWQKRRETLTGAVAHCMVEPELVPILDAATGEPIKAYEIDTRRAVVQRQGISRSRPRFPNWMVKPVFVYDDDFLPKDQAMLQEQFVAVLSDAGNRLGVGDYRPQKTGWFGRFTATL